MLQVTYQFAGHEDFLFQLYKKSNEAIGAKEWTLAIRIASHLYSLSADMYTIANSEEDQGHILRQPPPWVREHVVEWTVRLRAAAHGTRCTMLPVRARQHVAQRSERRRVAAHRTVVGASARGSTSERRTSGFAFACPFVSVRLPRCLSLSRVLCGMCVVLAHIHGCAGYVGPLGPVSC